MMTGRSTRLNILFFVPLFLWTCGGGGGGSTAPEPPQLPTVTNIEVTTLEDTPTTFAFTGTDPLNSALSYSVSTQPQHGAISISGGAGTYTPNANYNGQDVIAYIATSINGNSNIGTIIITITPVDDEPNTMDVTAITDEDNAVTVTLEAEEVDGQTIQFNVTGNPSNGSVTISGTTATYTPNQDWFGTDTFNFEAVDVSSKSILNSATATITVNPINDAPEVENIDGVEVIVGESFDISLQGSDIENDNLTYSIVDNPSNGSVTISGNSATYIATAEGSDTFTYKANDGTDDSNTATVSITTNNSFERTFGGTGPDEGNSINITSDGGYILGGRFDPVSGTGYQMFLVKTGAAGDEEWSNIYGNPNDRSDIYSVEQTLDGGYIIGGHSETRLTLLKIDSSGNEEWLNRYGSSNNYTFGDNTVRQTSDGGYIIAGKELVKTDASGNQEWITGQILAKSVQITPDTGYIVIDGTSQANLIKFDSTGNEEWRKVITGLAQTEPTGRSVVTTPDGGYMILGGTPSVIILTKTDTLGDIEWSVNIGGTDNNYWGFSIQRTTDQGYIITGVVGDDIRSVLLLKVDSSGNEEWSNIFGTTSVYDAGYSVKQTSDEGYVIGGYTNSYGSGSSDMYLIKTDSEGNRIF
jgi:hypothetical protein